MAYSRSTVTVSVMIANKEIEWPLMDLEIKQPSFGHHEAKVSVALDIEESAVDSRFLSIADFQDALGKSLTVKVTPADEYVGADELLEFVGIVSNITFENNPEQINLVTFHAKSPTWLMDQAKFNRFWEDKDLSAIVNETVGRYNIEKGDFNPPSGSQSFVVQFKETDWAFLCRICARESKWLYYDGKKLSIDQAKSKNTHELDWVKHIGSFDLKMKVSNLDYRTDVYEEGGQQQFFTDSTKGASSTDFSNLTSKVHSVSKSLFKDKSFDPFPQHADSDTNTVKYLANRRQAAVGELVKCIVQSNVPAIKIGDTIKVVGMRDFSATYMVAEVKHIVEEGSYRNELEAIPLETAHPSWSAPATEIPQFQAGVVTNNQDPDNRYRVRVKLNYTDEDGNQLETPFLRVIANSAGDNHGTYFLPEVGDEVMVGFERDNPEKPVVIGNLWNGQVTPDGELPHAENNFKGIYTRAGNRIDIGDADGGQFIKISNAGKNTIYLECDGPKIKVYTEGDLEVEAKQNISMICDGNFNIESKGNFSATSEKAVEIKAGTNMTSSAPSGDIKLEAINVKIDATANVESTANANNEMTGSAVAKVSGGIVKVEGSGAVNVQGAIINLN